MHASTQARYLEHRLPADRIHHIKRDTYLARIDATGSEDDVARRTAATVRTRLDLL